MLDASEVVWLGPVTLAVISALSAPYLVLFAFRLAVRLVERMGF